MSAYTPSMGGRVDKTDPKLAINFSPIASEVEVPAILRLSPADKNTKPSVGLKVQMQAPCMQTESESAKVSNMLKIHMQPTNVSAIPSKLQPGYVPNAAAVVDAELLQQIPGLKETLRALDSEMHANASCDVEKRLQMHERILQLQGQQLEQTVKAVGKIFDTQALHAKVHSAAGHRLLSVEANTTNLKEMSDLQTEVQSATASRLFANEKNTRSLQQTSELHTQLHHASGAGLIGMQEDMKGLVRKNTEHNKKMNHMHKQLGELENDSKLHGELHGACGTRVLELKDQVKSLGKQTQLHANVHKCSGNNVIKLQGDMRNIDAKVSELCSLSNELSRRSDLYTRLHKESNNFMKEKVTGACKDGDTLVGSDVSRASQDELKQLRADLNALALENIELKKSVSMHGKLHAKTAAVVEKLGLQKQVGSMVISAHAAHATTEAHAGHTPTNKCNCDGKGTCATCIAKTSSNHNEKRGMPRDNVNSHSQLLMQLQNDIASSNKMGKNRR